MANPIIKIKRGSGTPNVWGQTNGITAGEFAYDKTNNTLYIGITGGYCGAAAGTIDQILLADTAHNVIPIGMQISNDNTFAGPGAVVDEYLGYSNRTVPTTKAVKDYVAEVKSNTAAGFTFYAGVGISFELADPLNQRQGLTFNNTGVLRGFTATNLTGNVYGDNKIEPQNAKDLLELNAGSGIQFVGDTTGKQQIKIINIGVTGINGRTGDIKNFDVIQSLSGFTTSVGFAVRETLVPQFPIEIAATTPSGYSIIAHGQELETSAGSYGGIVGGRYYLPRVTVNKKGHVTGLTETELNFGSILPLGFTEAVEDIAFSGITSVNGNPSTSGICFEYVDNGSGRGLLYAVNTGVKSLGIAGGTSTTGDVKVIGGTGISLIWSNLTNKAIDIQSTTPHYKTITANRASDFLSGDIWSGGFTGPGTLQYVVADSYADTLKLYAGRGIGISAGQFGINDGILFWNAGINTIIPLDASGNRINNPSSAGFSGDMEIQAGANITFTRPTPNKLVIASAGGSSTGSVTHLHADYGINQTNITDQTTESLGVTGTIEFIGRDGIITRQTTSTDTPTTQNGNLYVGLSSKVYIPSNSFQGSADAPHIPDTAPVGYAEIVLPATKETNGGSNPTLPPLNYQTYPTYNRVKSELFTGGITAILTDIVPTLDDGGNLGDPTKSISGEMLIIRAEPGDMKRTNGTSIPSTGQHAEIRLLAWPNPENIGYYIDGVWTGVTELGAEENAGACDGVGCVGFPPELPGCASLVDGLVVVDDTLYLGSADEPSIVAHGNLIARDSVFVNKDIWLAGSIINAKTGCLISGGGSSPGSPGSAFNGYLDGTLTVTGYDTNLNHGSVYVHGATAHFNVNDFAIEDSLIKIGGISGGLPLNGTETQGHRQSDRGIIFYTNMSTPALAVENGANSTGETNKDTFVGIDQSEGVFKLISAANISTDGNNVTTVSGIPLSMYVGDINGAGITSDTSAGYVYLKGKNVSNSPVTNTRLYGHVQMNAPSSAGAVSNITLGNSAVVTLGASTVINTTNSPVIDFVRGITFDVATVGNGVGQGSAGNGQNSLVLRWKRNTDSSTSHITFRNLAADSWTQAVDIGRHITGLSNGNIQYTIESPQQTLYNKTLGENTVIDCGSY